jgi:hypothetical protein
MIILFDIGVLYKIFASEGDGRDLVPRFLKTFQDDTMDRVLFALKYQFMGSSLFHVISALKTCKNSG